MVDILLSCILSGNFCHCWQGQASAAGLQENTWSISLSCMQRGLHEDTECLSGCRKPLCCMCMKGGLHHDSLNHVPAEEQGCNKSVSLKALCSEAAGSLDRPACIGHHQPSLAPSQCFVTSTECPHYSDSAHAHVVCTNVLRMPALQSTLHAPQAL